MINKMPMNPGMNQLQSALESKPINVDELQLKRELEQQKQPQQGMGMGQMMDMGKSAYGMGKTVAGWFG